VLCAGFCGIFTCCQIGIAQTHKQQQQRSTKKSTQQFSRVVKRVKLDLKKRIDDICLDRESYKEYEELVN